MAAGRSALQMRSQYTWWSIPCVSAWFYFTPPSLFSELKPLKIIGMWKSHFFYQFHSLQICCLCTHPERKMHTNNTRHVFYNLTVYCSELLSLSQLLLQLLPPYLIKKKNLVTAENSDISQTITASVLLFVWSPATESANCCFLFDHPAAMEVLSGPVWRCSPTLFTLFR